MGLGLHIPNPKAVFSWTTIVVLRMPADAPAYHVFTILAGCAVLAMITNFSYVILFFNRNIIDVYSCIKRWINETLAVLFAITGVRLLTWHT